jgi:alpha-L-fucosidase
MEWLNEGQRIEKYSVDVWTGSAWKSVATAHAIGHEKIDVFAPVTASRVRLNIQGSVNGAAVREFQLYDVR